MCALLFYFLVFPTNGAVGLFYLLRVFPLSRSYHQQTAKKNPPIPTRDPGKFFNTSNQPNQNRPLSGQSIERILRHGFSPFDGSCFFLYLCQTFAWSTPGGKHSMLWKERVGGENPNFPSCFSLHSIFFFPLVVAVVVVYVGSWSKWLTKPDVDVQLPGNPEQTIEINLIYFSSFNFFLFSFFFSSRALSHICRWSQSGNRNADTQRCLRSFWGYIVSIACHKALTFYYTPTAVRRFRSSLSAKSKWARARLQKSTYYDCRRRRRREKKKNREKLWDD